ncbi:unnamed protein product [Rangifer tarandus platyrhynchus]|uniref:Uncharacterized protein n=1 Tax=Rangifer tarandus platyrhynchus TaxID=3082113 RepID=A0ABN9A7N4_RANTA|nr:unnamed protein product [Rangifer tarandus platyrhynchus]
MSTPQPQLQGPLAHCLPRLHLDSVPFHISSSGDADSSLGSHLHESRNQDQLQKTKLLNCSYLSAQRRCWVIAQCAPVFLHRLSLVKANRGYSSLRGIGFSLWWLSLLQIRSAKGLIYGSGQV